MILVQLLFLLQLVILSFQKEPSILPITTPELCRYYGYPSETHTIETTDGYLLTIHRIPIRKSSKSPNIAPAIFLQHGMGSCSNDWVTTGPNQALGFLLADLGYDVWMGNSRGNTYSRAHKTLNPNSTEFWQFSWDELALYDLPTVIDYIIDTTNQQKISYVSHSLGTTTFFALMSARPEYNDKFNVMIALAPVVYVQNVRSPVRVLSLFTSNVKFSEKLLGNGEFLPHSKPLENLLRYLFLGNEFERSILKLLLSLIFGFDYLQIADEVLSRVISYIPAGTSSLTFIQSLQQINSGRFCRFDHGETINQIKYNSSLPPLYNLENVQVPVALFYGDNDVFIAQQDLKLLTEQLPNIIESYQIPYPGFDHLDLLLAKDAPTLVHQEVIRILAITSPTDNSYQAVNPNQMLYF